MIDLKNLRSYLRSGFLKTQFLRILLILRIEIRFRKVKSNGFMGTLKFSAKIFTFKP